jgi:sigma-54 dependent transcriptional regulator, acetoin dehydrogenase operon transcriptional activator AcoR
LAVWKHGFDRGSHAAPGEERDPLAAELARTCPLPAGAAGGATARRPSGTLVAIELARRLDDTYRLALPVLEASVARLGSSGNALAFFDSAGWMLWLGGDRSVAECLARLDFRPGTRWLGDAPAATPRPAGAADRRALELVVSDRAAPDAWRCASAPILGRPAGEWLGTVHVTSRGGADALADAGAIADAVEERVRSARSVREHVVDFALRAAGSAEAVFAVDASGRLLAASPEARRRFALDPDVPERVREDLCAALEQAPESSHPELELEWPGAPSVKLAASPVRVDGRAVGGILRATASQAAARPSQPPAPRPAARYAFDRILGESEAIRAALALARTAARNDLPVVLRGESGTGKELFAQAIHSASARAAGPFVAMNCGCIPASLLEAELFGYEPGTFTGGRREGNAGKFERAAKGTLFLDEVTELSAQAQTALLRVLQEREVVRLGGSAPRPIDVRVVAAASQALADAVRAGRFRDDLYYRLNVLPLTIPPLRERTGDVAFLARELLAEAEAELGRSGLSFSADAIAALEAHPWPGNVRELRNIVLRSAATAEGPVIRREDLPREVRAPEAWASHSAARAFAAPLAPGLAEAGSPDRDALLAALQGCAWNVARTASLLKVSRMTLYRWLRKFQIHR